MQTLSKVTKQNYLKFDTWYKKTQIFLFLLSIYFSNYNVLLNLNKDPAEGLKKIWVGEGQSVIQGFLWN